VVWLLHTFSRFKALGKGYILPDPCNTYDVRSGITYRIGLP
jgi:hypothetical protein